MSVVFIIEDEAHSDKIGRHDSYDEALSALIGYSKLPWNKEPNVCPCTSWKTCTREYKITEYEITDGKWKYRNETRIFDISENGVVWKIDIDNTAKQSGTL